jgi:opacity protein-like surface antigen
MKKFLIFAVVVSILSSANSFADSILYVTPHGDSAPIRLDKDNTTLSGDRIEFSQDGHKATFHAETSAQAKAVHDELLSKNQYKVWSKPDKADGTPDSEWVVQQFGDPNQEANIPRVTTMTMEEFVKMVLNGARVPSSLHAKK